MKIIKIKTCYDCPFHEEKDYHNSQFNTHETEHICMKDIELPVTGWACDSYGTITDETVWDGQIPDDCPLEDVNAKR